MNKAQWIHSELDGFLWLKIIYVVGIIFIELKRDEVKNVISDKLKSFDFTYAEKEIVKFFDIHFFKFFKSSKS